MANNMREKLGNGGQYRKEIYAEFAKILNRDINEREYKKIHDILIQYVVAIQEDIIQRMVSANELNNQLSDKIKLLTEGKHFLCEACKNIRKFRKSTI